jgi:Outer membrane protein Omp28
MKNLFILTLISGMLLYSCKDDSKVTPGDGTGSSEFKLALKQKNTGFYFTGNWCGPCGLYGSPAIANMSNKYGTDFVWVSCQLNDGAGKNDPFNTSDANTLSTVFPGNEIPIVWVGSYGDPFQSAIGGTMMQDSLDGFLATGRNKIPKANIGVDYEISDGAISVSTETEFFEDTDLEYMVSAYVLEDKLIERQLDTDKGWLNGSEFNNILRIKLSSNVLGDNLPLTAKTKGTIDAMAFGDFLQSNWKEENLKVMVVLWSKDATGNITAVNATMK